jgi:DNA invertase Pin-like site-specific DNA recombinase
MYSKIVKYLRVSDPNQVQGLGLDGQLRDIDALVKYAVPDSALPVVIIREEGRSGFHGDHRSRGKLGEFEAEVLAAEHQGALFVCEKLDRLSRQGHRSGMDLVQSMIDHGVTVRTTQGDWFKAGEDVGLVQDITARLKLDLAQTESINKSSRTTRNWEIARENAKANKLAVSKLVPPWIIVKSDKTMEPYAERAALVRRMFEMADAGLGAKAIADTFTREGISTWERFAKRHAKVWQRSFISKTLANRACVGEYIPHVGGEAQEPWPDHFPIVVDAALFARVNGSAQNRKASARGMRSEKVVNLVSGLMKCTCGANLHYSRGRAAGHYVTAGGKAYSHVRDTGSLICPTAVASQGKLCPNTTYLAYLTFEDALVDSCLHFAMEDGAFSNRSEVGRLDVTIAERTRAHELAEANARKFWSAWLKAESEMAMTLSKEAELAAKSIAANLIDLRAQRESAAGRVSSEAHLARVADIKSQLYAENLETRVMVRRKVSQSLRALINKAVYDGDKVHVYAAKGVLAFVIDRKGRVELKYELYKPWAKHGRENVYGERRAATIAGGSRLALPLLRGDADSGWG